MFCTLPAEGDGNLCKPQMMEMKMQVPKHYTNGCVSRIKPEPDQGLFPSTSTHDCMYKGKKEPRADERKERFCGTFFLPHLGG